MRALTYAPWNALEDPIPRRGNALTRAIARGVLRLLGWHLTGTLPRVPRMVMLAAPHTSNWDFPLGVLAMFGVGFRASFLGKHTLFRPPLGWLMRALGGRPVDRSAAHGVVEESVRAIRAAPGFILALAPEGTRKRTPRWRTGFWHVARGADLPIVLGYFDYAAREIGFGPTLWPSDDLAADLTRIQDFYREKQGKHPEHFATAADPPELPPNRPPGG